MSHVKNVFTTNLSYNTIIYYFSLKIVKTVFIQLNYKSYHYLLINVQDSGKMDKVSIALKLIAINERV